MKPFLFSSLLTGCCILLSNCAVDKSHSEWSVPSPDKSLKITVELKDKALYYYVTKDRNGKAVEVVERARLGITRTDQDFSGNIQFLNTEGVKIVDEEYTMVTGKQKELRNLSNEQVLSFTNNTGSKMDLILRAYNEGVAFRYHFPEISAEIHTISDESTCFKLDTAGKAWMMPYSRPSIWGPAYESNYSNGIAIGTPSRSDQGWAFPLLFNTNGMWVLITEAGVDSTSYGARVMQDAENGLYKIRLPDPAEGLGNGTVEALSPLPWSSPWRIIMAGPTPGSIVENNMVHHLSEPCRIEDTSWIKPGRASWSWWSDHSSPRDINKLKRFIDLSKEMTWEYSLIDANWNIMKTGNIDQLRKYAEEKGVGLLLWYNSGGPHNTVTEQPRDIMYDKVLRRAEMKKLSEWGIKGVKVDFFHSDKQAMMTHYLNILKDAAEFQLLVDFHGCTLPRGWARTWPNLMSMEGVKGAEQYTGDTLFAENANVFNTIYAFTRNVVGSMDYTPVTFSNYSTRTAHTTTMGHELALSVIFESGLQHFADRDSAYLSAPVYVQDFLRHIPVAWDETRYISGEPGKFIVLARRKGDVWYLAGIDGEKQVQNLSVPLFFIADDGTKSLSLITDSRSENDFSFVHTEITKSDTLEITIEPRGGFAAVIQPE